MKPIDPDFSSGMNRCRHYSRCAAPLCPLDSFVQEKFWYIGEPICRNPCYARISWIQIQKRIQRSRKPFPPDHPIGWKELLADGRPRQMSFDQLETNQKTPSPRPLPFPEKTSDRLK